jgi:dTDP-4-amino-4,6-dideoxygalactose transaminase
MEFIDLSTQQKRISERVNANIRRVLTKGQYINGPEVEELEKALADYAGTKFAIGCASGTDALLLGLMAYGIGPGDAVLTTPFTFIATAEVIRLLGAVPIFVDVNPRTFNIDAEQLEIAIKALKTNDHDSYPLPCKRWIESVTPRGIIGVDLFGLPSDYEKINHIARKYNLFVIEDAAQSFGAEYHGKKTCSLTEIGCTSFFPAKPLGCYGDGGMCFTNDGHLSEVIRSLTNHGKGQHKYDNVRIGINGRLDTLQAAILLAKFEIFQEEIASRQVVAGRYSELIGGNTEIATPLIPEGSKSAWAQYSVLFKAQDSRKSCQEKMAAANIPAVVYYPKPLHLQTAFSDLGYREGDFVISENLSKRILSLPMHPYLSLEEQTKVVEAILER